MRSCPVVLAAVLAAFAACTSVPPFLTGSTSGSNSSSEARPVAAGLKPVRDYAQEFCGAERPMCLSGAVPDSLRRPLQIPSVSPDAACPVSQANPQIWSRQAPGLGPGPVGPVGLGTDAVLRYRPASHGNPWGKQKVLWASSPDYLGPILVRGGRVDEPGGLGFSVGNGPPLAELQLPPIPAGSPARGSNGWAGWPSYTRVQAPGCYAYQVDGTDFSYTIVFQAVPLH